MSAGVYNDTIEVGADWVLEITLEDLNGDVITRRDLTGYQAQCQLKPKPGDTRFVIDATCTINVPETNGEIRVVVPYDLTKTIPDWCKTLSYDVELVKSDLTTIERVIEGVLTVSPNITTGPVN